MKKTIAILLLATSFCACENDADNENATSSITINFTHTWNGQAVTNTDFNIIKYINEKGNSLSISRLRYLISNVTLTNTQGESLTLSDYNLIDVTNTRNVSFTPTTAIPIGNYNNMAFTFGFNNTDNYVVNGYADLNAASFNVPKMLGGGYHYMQLDGKFINNNNEEQGYNYHVIRAVDNLGGNPSFPQDTFFNVDLGPVKLTSNTVITVEMDIAEWFKTPNTWDLNVLSQSLMPNASAQIMMFENGQNVFKLKSIE